MVRRESLFEIGRKKKLLTPWEPYISPTNLEGRGMPKNLTASHPGPAYPSAINQKGFKYRMLAVRTRNIGDFIGIKQENVKEIVLIVASLRTF